MTLASVSDALMGESDTVRTIWDTQGIKDRCVTGTLNEIKRCSGAAPQHGQLYPTAHALAR